jgi:hypothetical protein
VEELLFSAIEGSSPLEMEISIAKFKKYKSPGSDQILAEIIQSGGKMLLPGNYIVINSIWNKEELPEQWEDSIIVPISRMYKTGCNGYRGTSLLTIT